MPPSAHIHFEFPGTAFEFLSDAPNAIPVHPNNDFEFVHPVWVNIILKGIGMRSNPQRSLFLSLCQKHPVTINGTES